jgi:hypothetical protein
MKDEKSKDRITRIILIICGLIIIGIIGIPKLYQNYHSAPNYNATGRIIIFEDHKTKTHKLNKYQKNQFLKIAKKAIDAKDGPFDWNNYRVVYLDVYKTQKKHEYALILKVKPRIKIKNSEIKNSMVVKLNRRNLIDYYKTSIRRYSSEFSNEFIDSN